MKLLHIIIGCLLLSCSGCLTEKKAMRQVNRAILNYRTESAKKLRETFPCDTSSVTQTENTTDTLIEVYCPDVNTDYEIKDNPNPFAPQFGKKKVSVWVKVPLYKYYITQKVADHSESDYWKGNSEKYQVEVTRLNKSMEAKSKSLNYSIIAAGVMSVAFVVSLLFKK